MKLNAIQNRRDFFKCSLQKGIKYLGSITGIIVSDPNLFYNNRDCQNNISCRNCYKMGICEEDEAEQARAEVKRDNQIVKVSKGTKNV